MEGLKNLVWHDGKLFGATLTVWVVIGWIGNAVFFSRFIVQWYATEKRGQVVVPVLFWWLSLSGALLLLVYAISKNDWVIIFAYAFTWIPYIRNLVIHHRHLRAEQTCGGCGTISPPAAKFCANCGSRLARVEIQSADCK